MLPAAEAAGTTPPNSHQTRDTQLLWRPPPRPHFHITTDAPRSRYAERGAELCARLRALPLSKFPLPATRRRDGRVEISASRAHASAAGRVAVLRDEGNIDASLLGDLMARFHLEF